MTRFNRIKRKRLSALLAFCVGFSVLLAGCSQGSSTNGNAANCTPATFSIGVGTGMGFSAMIVLKGTQYYEKKFPDTKFTWTTLSGGAANRDAILSGSIDMGSGGNTTYLVGWDKGLNIKLLSSLGDIDYWLMTTNPKVKSMGDITPNMRIAVTSPDAGQAIVLNKAGNDLGKNFKQQMVPMPHPDAVSALLNGQIDLHYSSPPFQYQELARGAHVVAKGSETWGVPYSFSVAYVNQKTAECAKFTKGLYDGFVYAMGILKNDPAQAAKLLSESDSGKVTPDQYAKWLKEPGIDWTVVPHNVLKESKESKTLGFLSKVPSSMDELVASAVPKDKRGN